MKRGGNLAGYNGDGQICAVASWSVVDDAMIMTGYLYDAEGSRVAKGTISAWSCDPTVNGFQTTNDYVLGLSGEQVTEMGMGGVTAGGTTAGLAWEHTNVWAGGTLLATYDHDGLHFYFDDPLGTRRVQTDSSGVVEQNCQSLPYGDGESCAPTPTEHLFTGKERDSESGNDYFGARYYASSMGRFLSPDWSAKAEPVPYAKLDNPQSLNLYTYALNNPLRNIDKDGHCDSSANATANTKCQDVKNLHVNDAMKDKIKKTEGDPKNPGSPVLKVYKDGAGNLTVGWGHKVTAADGLKEGDTIKTDQAQKLFDSDLSSKESAVSGALSQSGHQFSQGEYNALVDLTYNGGPGMLTTSMSPNLMKDINAGDYEGMYGQLRYTKDSAGRVEPGLVTRSDDRKAIAQGDDPE
jgi:RHS repeat-associated protein